MDENKADAQTSHEKWLHTNHLELERGAHTFGKHFLGDFLCALKRAGGSCKEANRRGVFLFGVGALTGLFIFKWVFYLKFFCLDHALWHRKTMITLAWTTSSDMVGVNFWKRSLSFLRRQIRCEGFIWKSTNKLQCFEVPKRPPVIGNLSLGCSQLHYPRGLQTGSRMIELWHCRSIISDTATLLNPRNLATSKAFSSFKILRRTLSFRSKQEMVRQRVRFVKRVKRCWKLLVAVLVYLFAIFSFVLRRDRFFMHLC